MVQDLRHAAVFIHTAQALIESKGSGFHLGIRISRVARLLHLLLLDRKAVTVICIAHNSDDLYLFFFLFNFYNVLFAHP